MSHSGNNNNKPQSRDVPALNQLYFYLTEGCNLTCRHCWLAPKFDPTAERYPTLPPELFEKAIQEAKPLGLSGVKLTGGEPLMHPEINQLLEIVRREGLGLTVETNGVLCTAELAEEIARSENSFVSVSLDGADAETHEWVRGVAGCFEGAKQGIKNLVGAGIQPQIILSVMRINADQVGAIVRLAEELGASSVKFNVIQPIGRGEKIHDGATGLDVAEVIELGRYVEMELIQETELRLIFDYPMAFRRLSRIASGDGCGVCGVLGIMGVLASGHYALCGIGEHVPELVFGQVESDPLEKVWRESMLLEELRIGLPSRLEGICSRCLMKERCRGSCIAQNYYRSGNLWTPYWLCEAAEEMNIFPSSRLNYLLRETHPLSGFKNSL
jgi:SynChlorMet cassette radical SAM/SPASM protein ScmF